MIETGSAPTEAHEQDHLTCAACTTTLNEYTTAVNFVQHNGEQTVAVITCINCGTDSQLVINAEHLPTVELHSRTLI